MPIWVHIYLWFYKSIDTETGSNHTMQTGLTVTVHHPDLKLMLINSRISEWSCFIILTFQ